MYRETIIAIDLQSRVSLNAYPELMDQPCSYADLRDCLRDICMVNRLTHAYAPTFQWLTHLCATIQLPERPLHIVDVGCGDGDMLRKVHRWAQQRKVPVVLTGIDLNPHAIAAATEAPIPSNLSFVEGNAYDFQPAGGIDIVISSLLTHHLENHEVVEFLRWMERSTRLGWFVNDLHRQKLPYYAFKFFSSLTNWHRFVKHDGAISILRSFRREDWEALMRAAGVNEGDVVIKEFRPARLCVARLQKQELLLEAGFRRDADHEAST